MVPSFDLNPSLALSTCLVNPSIREVSLVIFSKDKSSTFLKSAKKFLSKFLIISSEVFKLSALLRLSVESSC